MDGVKGLNQAGGKNRFRFLSFADRVKVVDDEVQRATRGRVAATKRKDEVRTQLLCALVPGAALTPLPRPAAVRPRVAVR